MNDLWGDIPDAVNLVTPLEVLKEQASTLTKKTRGRITGSIRRFEQTSVGHWFRFKRESPDPYLLLPASDFHYGFELLVPSLNNYTYSVLEMGHGVHLYPVLLADLSTQQLRIHDDVDSYLEGVAGILQSDKVRSVIASLLKQAIS